MFSTNTPKTLKEEVMLNISIEQNLSDLLANLEAKISGLESEDSFRFYENVYDEHQNCSKMAQGVRGLLENRKQYNDAHMEEIQVQMRQWQGKDFIFNLSPGTKEMLAIKFASLIEGYNLYKNRNNNLHYMFRRKKGVMLILVSNIILMIGFGLLIFTVYMSGKNAL